jgi:hypothetical protein
LRFMAKQILQGPNELAHLFQHKLDSYNFEELNGGRL